MVNPTGPDPRPSVVRFGVCELDARGGELRRNGFKIRVQNQSLQILTLLLERPGALVTREEIQKRLWATGTIVEFDHSINAAVKKLRQALGDSAENPRFVETVPRRGYRFLLPIDPSAVELDDPTDAQTDLVGPLVAGIEGPRVARKSRLLSRAVKLMLVLSGFATAAVVILLSLRTRTPTPIGNSISLTGNPGWEEFPSFSPNGNQVSFSWSPKFDDNSDIYVKVIGGGPALKLTTGSGTNFAPAWSHDGRQIAYLRQNTDGSDIFIVPALGGPSRKIGHSRAIPYGMGSMFNPRLSWSPDDKDLAIADKAPVAEGDSIFLLSVTTGEKRQLTFPERRIFDGLPAFSPEGGRLAFARFSGEAGEICVLLLDKDRRANGQPRRITSVNHGPAGLDWTPDGREILYSHTKIWRVSADGGQPMPVPNTDVVFQVALSHHVWRLAYTRLSFIAGIWRFNGPNAPENATNHPEKVISSNGIDIAPQFSPDGKRVVFASDRSGTAEIWMTNGDGTSPVQLTSMGGDWLTTGDPRWSPDGKQIAFDSFRNGRWRIYTMTIESRIVRQLTTGIYDCADPSWSRDGRWVYFRSRDQVWKTPAAGGAAPIQVTRYGGDEPFESWDSKFVYYHKDDDIWKVATTGRDETRVVEHAVHGHWTLLPSGICFIDGWRKPDPALEFFDFSRRRRRILSVLPRSTASWDESAVTASPDGRWVLCVRGDHVESSIRIVENFR